MDVSTITISIIQQGGGALKNHRRQLQQKTISQLAACQASVQNTKDKVMGHIAMDYSLVLTDSYIASSRKVLVQSCFLCRWILTSAPLGQM